MGIATGIPFRRPYGACVGEDIWLDSSALVAAAAEAGFQISTRSLEHWRHRGLLPRPQRVGRPARWLNPPGTLDQLLALVQARETTNALDLLTLALWIDGFAIETGTARKALLSFARRWTACSDRELALAAKSGSTLGGAIDARAAQLSRLRGRAPVPKTVRMTLDQRARAYGYALSLMLGVGEEIERREGDAELTERMLGLRRGASGGLAVMLGVGIASEIIQPHAAELAIQSANDSELEFARRLTQILLTWVPMLLPVMRATEGDKARDFTTLARVVFENADGELEAACLMALVARIGQARVAPAELERALAEIESPAVGAELLLATPPAMRQGALARLAPGERKRTLEYIAGRRALAGSE